MTEEHAKEATKGCQIITDTGDTKFVHIILYNSLRRTDDTKEGFDAICTIYFNLFVLHGFMAAFQFMTLEKEINTNDTIEVTIYSIQYLGFALNLAGALTCLVVQEYIKCISNEKIETQVRGICRYAMFVQMGDYMAILASLCLILASNVNLWKNGLPVFLAIGFNVFFALGLLLFMRAHYVMIVQRQGGRDIYKDKNFIAAQERNKTASICDKLKGMFGFMLGH